MAEVGWENEDFEPKVFKKTDDRWEGEDEDDDIKDNWDDEEEEDDSKEADKPQQNIVAVQPKKKKPIAVIIAEKEEKERKELEKKRKLAEKKPDEKISAAEALARKLEQQKLQEEADLELAKETFGITESTKVDHLNPTTKEEFDVFRKALVEKISKYESSGHYLAFLEDLCRDLCLDLQPDDTKKITASLTALVNEKQKAQKSAKSKKKSSKKATLNIGKDSLGINDYGVEYDVEDFL